MNFVKLFSQEIECSKKNSLSSPCMMCVHYFGGCSGHRGVLSTSGDTMSTSGDTMSASEGYHEYIGGYHDAC